jgi:hypothetical protein
MNSALAKLLDFSITLALTNLGRTKVVEKVAELDEQGKTPAEITEHLAAWAENSETSAEAAVEALPH